MPHKNTLSKGTYFVDHCKFLDTVVTGLVGYFTRVKVEVHLHWSLTDSDVKKMDRIPILSYFCYWQEFNVNEPHYDLYS